MYYGPQPDPAGYTQLLKAAYPAIKAADPEATVVGGVVGSTITYGNLTMNPVTFVDQMYQDGAQGYFDALSFHPYQYTTPFSQGGYLPDSPINQLTDIRNLMVANGDADKLVWASEYGEPSSVAGETQQAAYLQDMLTTWRTLSYAGPAFVYTLQDTDSSSSDPEATIGLIRSDGTWKPAAYVVQSLASSSTTTPAMARMALAMPGAQQAAPADLATLTALAETPAVPQSQTPVDGVMAAAAAAVAGVDQLASAVIQRVVAMMPSAPETPKLETPKLETPKLETPVLKDPIVATPALQTPSTSSSDQPTAPEASTDAPKKTAEPSKRSADSAKRSAGKHERTGDGRHQPRQPNRRS
jgi:hypothetical protein